MRNWLMVGVCAMVALFNACQSMPSAAGPNRPMLISTRLNYPMEKRPNFDARRPKTRDFTFSETKSEAFFPDFSPLRQLSEKLAARNQILGETPAD